MISVTNGAQVALSRHDLSAGPVVATLAVITLLAIVAVLALTYVMHLRDRQPRAPSTARGDRPEC